MKVVFLFLPAKRLWGVHYLKYSFYSSHRGEADGEVCLVRKLWNFNTKS